MAHTDTQGRPLHHLNFALSFSAEKEALAGHCVVSKDNWHGNIPSGFEMIYTHPSGKQDKIWFTVFASATTCHRLVPHADSIRKLTIKDGILVPDGDDLNLCIDAGESIEFTCEAPLFVTEKYYDSLFSDFKEGVAVSRKSSEYYHRHLDVTYKHEKKGRYTGVHEADNFPGSLIMNYRNSSKGEYKAKLNISFGVRVRDPAHNQYRAIHKFKWDPESTAKTTKDG